MRKLAIVALLGGLVGCNSLSGAQQDCTGGSPAFLPMWQCIKSRIAAGRAGDMNNDLGLRYVATGNALAERVRRGAMGDAEAKLALAEELSRSTSEYQRRAGKTVACMPVGGFIACQ